ncbi:hypothetical protein PHMEG_00013650 [Phytophthora megakarya]|uniref:Uncharacterized protein n=1 Tax=Phytophthora megakarya TaxID=4795 RepID=A0A225W8C7_9STRA|nr:hypothetical protein PHMEG_00013650 [Phytophthora megakarya]
MNGSATLLFWVVLPVDEIKYDFTMGSSLHWMLLTSAGNCFQVLPAPTIEQLWCFQEARVIAEELESATASLSRFVQCSKL